MQIDGSHWIKMGYPLYFFEKLIVFHLIPGDGPSASSTKDPVVDELEIAFHSLALRILIV